MSNIVHNAGALLAPTKYIERLTNGMIFQMSSSTDGYTYDHLYDQQSERVWIGYGSTVSDEETGLLPVKSYEQIKDDIALMLEPYIRKGLIELNPKKFGVWTIFTGH
jgi:hypothetical protein